MQTECGLLAAGTLHEQEPFPSNDNTAAAAGAGGAFAADGAAGAASVAHVPQASAAAAVAAAAGAGGAPKVLAATVPVAYLPEASALIQRLDGGNGWGDDGISNALAEVRCATRAPDHDGSLFACVVFHVYVCWCSSRYWLRSNAVTP